MGEADSGTGSSETDETASVELLGGLKPKADGLERERLLAKVTAGLTTRPVAPVKIDRYVILEPLGQGGMGVVYAAWDPRLHRRVALKLVRSEGLSAGARESSLNEARSLAQLTHPNVVAVHEVGEHGDGLYIVMELVEGKSLDRWLRAAKRSQAEVVAIFVQAGRGLAAAHERGLVHRDFKPSNVLIGDDGRVRVVDFGLARAVDDARQAEPVGVTGTPAYMAPEQHRGEVVDARSDQYSFCVSLWEALFGVRPFRQSRLSDLLAAKELGAGEGPAGVSVDSRLRRLVARGLSPTPEGRFESMRAVLEELDHRPPRWGRWAVASIAVGSLIGLTYYGAKSDPSTACQDPQARLAGVWDAGRRAELEEAFRDSEVAFAIAAHAKVEAGIETYTQAWMAAYADACEAGRVLREQSVEFSDRRMACLEERKRELGALVSVLAQADREVVNHSVQALSNLRPVQPCSDPKYLDRRVEPPGEDARDAIDDQRRRLLESAALQAAGKLEEASALALSVRAAADEIGYPPFRAEALLRLGEAENGLGRPAEAEQVLIEAWTVALASRDDARAAEIATRLVDAVGFGQARPDEGLFWADNAGALLDRDAEQGLARARLRHARAAVLIQAARYDEGLEDERAALELWSALPGDQDLAVAGALQGIGNALGRQGRYEEALEHYERALEIRRARLTDTHPAVAAVLDAMGVVLFERGDRLDAVEHYRQALGIRETALGLNHRDVGASLNNLGDALRSLGQYEQALEHQRRAHRIFVEALGEDHPHTGTVVANIGNVLWYMEDLDGAREHYERALASFERAFGSDHVNVAVARDNIARVLAQQGHYESALEHQRVALRILTDRLGEQHRNVIGLRVAMADVLLEKKDAKQAYAQLSLARDASEESELDVLARADIDFGLARAALALGRRAEAASAATSARDQYLRGEDPAHDNVAQVDAWRDEHGL